jgi:hypothetical protein
MIELDCMDNSCRYAKSKTGQRTNGGCRCLQGLSQEQRIKVHSFIADLQRQIAEAKSELAKHNLIWQSGKIPQNGWYWIKPSNCNHHIRVFYLFQHQWNRGTMDSWAGPLSEPSEGEKL